MHNKLAETQATLRAAEQALQDAITRQERMAEEHNRILSQVVHDIKNPLTAMMGFLSLIRNEFAGPLDHDTYARYIQTVDRSAGRLLNLCNSLLRQHGGHSTPPPPATDVAELVDEVGALFSAQALARGIGLTTTIDGKLPTLAADPDDLYRALTNLVSNALKFTPKGGQVDVQAGVDPQNNTFIMVVRDSGIGMTRDQVARILSMDISTPSPHGDIGTGLGLDIVNRIVTLYGGKLDIISTENRGTRIRMEFPQKIATPA